MLCLIGLQSIAQKKAPSAVDIRLLDLDTALQRVLTTWKGAGFAVAVVEKNKIIYQKGFGYRDYEQKLPVTPNTLFAIGSCSKAFTAALIGKLQGEGKLAIDNPVSSFVPVIKFYNDEMNNNITLRDMMSHRTGLPRHDLSWYFFNTNARDSIIQRVQYQEPTAKLRSTWQYNNFMYTAQGVIAEQLTGKTWEQNVKEHFFTPLEMITSNTSIAELEKSKDIAFGYKLYKDSIIKKVPYYHIDAMGPAGAINSSVAEMANWTIAWLNGGKFKGKEIFPANFYSQAIASQMIIGGGLPSKERPDLHFSNYGLGWMLSSYKGHYRVEHGGNIDGFSASTSFFPSDSIGIIVLTNQDGSKMPALIRNLVSDKILKLKYYDWNGDAKKAADKAKAEEQKLLATKQQTSIKTFPPTHPYLDFEGIYQNAGYGTLRVYLKSDSLFAVAGGSKLWLKHYSYDIFSVYMVEKDQTIDSTAAAPFKFQFQMSVVGDIESLSTTLEAGLKPLVFTKGVEAKATAVKELQKYIGEYLLNGLTVKIYIKDNKTLFALVPGQPDYELIPLGKDKFALKVIAGYFVQFEAKEDKQVTSLTFIQPNGNFKAEKKQ